MKKTLVTATLLLPLFGLWGQVWGWDGSGTSDDPYLIQTSDDWAELSKQVAAGNAYGDKYFMMSNDIDSKGVQVGSETAPFSGTFDGDGHTLTYNKGGGDPSFVNENCAPFGYLNGASVRHLKTTGIVYTSNRYNGGIAVFIDGRNDTRGTMLFDCSTEFAA